MELPHVHVEELLALIFTKRVHEDLSDVVEAIGVLVHWSEHFFNLLLIWSWKSWVSLKVFVSVLKRQLDHYFIQIAFLHSVLLFQVSHKFDCGFWLLKQLLETSIHSLFDITEHIDSGWIGAELSE